MAEATFGLSRGGRREPRGEQGAFSAETRRGFAFLGPAGPCLKYPPEPALGVRLFGRFAHEVGAGNRGAAGFVT